MSVIEHGEVTVSFQHTGFIERAGVKTGFIGVAVLRALLDHANHDTRTGWPSINTLCARTALSENSVLKGLRLLREHGFIKVSSRNAENGRQTTNEYRILDRELVASEGPTIMIRILKVVGFSSADRAAMRSDPDGEGSRHAALEQTGVESSKAKGVKATALDLSSGLRPSDKSRPGPAAGGTALSAASGGKMAKPTPKPTAWKRTATGGLWIPVTPCGRKKAVPVGCQGRTDNGVKATSKAKATSRATSTDEPPPPRVAGSAPAAGAVPRSLADPTRDAPAAPNAAHRPRQRAPRPTDPFFNLFGELVLGGSPTARTRGLAGEWATRCVENEIPERAIRDWRAELDVSRDVRFLREHNAWQMLFAWWSLRSGKYTQANNGRGALERFGSAGSGEQWAHIRYGIPADK